MFVAISQFTVANGMEPQVREAFVNRPHAVESAPGFVRMEVMTPREEPESFWLITFWKTEADFKQWHKGHQYQHSHQGIPKGLKLVPGRNQIQYFDHVAS